MKIKLTLLFYFCILSVSTYAQKDSKLWYTTPAKYWEEALPIGNGRIGAMIFGDTKSERIQFNENTLYSGQANMFTDPTKIYPRLNEVEDLLAKNKLAEAEAIIQSDWNGRLTEAYQPFGDIYLDFKMKGDVTDYRHELDLETAIVTTSYKQNGVAIKRELFASHPSQAIIIRITAEKPILNFDLRLTSLHPSENEVDRTQLSIQGNAPAHVQRRTVEYLQGIKTEKWHPEFFNQEGEVIRTGNVLYQDELEGIGMPFKASVLPISYNGKLKLKGNKLTVRKSSEVTLILVAATGYDGYDKAPQTEGKNVNKEIEQMINAIQGTSYTQLLAEHTSDYQNLFNRVDLNLPTDSKILNLPTDQRLARFNEGNDQSLIAQLFSFGRYLMIAGSRGQGQPLNLQGIWNDKIVPPWNSAYTMNINLEMNYWPAEVTNLSECHQPLFKFIKEMYEVGKVRAKQTYNLDGWVIHHNTSLWRETQLSDAFVFWRFWNLAGVWLCDHIAEHYAYTGDKDFLREYFPILVDAAKFCSGWMVRNEDGFLVTPVSTSPENSFYTEDGFHASISQGPTMDISLIRNLYNITLDAASILELEEDDFLNTISKEVKELAPYKIGEKGQLLEWDKEYKEFEPQHRHVSHLFGLYPGKDISKSINPEIAEAARQSLLIRGNKMTGWSTAWKISLWARLLDGENALDCIQNLINLVPADFHEENAGGLYRNLLNALPFQIDGNFGITAGIAEMLIQSHENNISLLPALPKEWREGSVKGLKARGGFTVDLYWKDGSLSYAEITSDSDQKSTILYSNKTTQIEFKKGEVKRVSHSDF